MTMNQDKYVDEIREIRRRHMEETKNLTPEERSAIIKRNSEEFQKLVAEKRAQRSSAK